VNETIDLTEDEIIHVDTHIIDTLLVKVVKADPDAAVEATARGQARTGPDGPAASVIL